MTVGKTIYVRFIPAAEAMNFGPLHLPGRIYRYHEQLIGSVDGHGNRRSIASWIIIQSKKGPVPDLSFRPDEGTVDVSWQTSWIDNAHFGYDSAVEESQRVTRVWRRVCIPTTEFQGHYRQAGKD